MNKFDNFDSPVRKQWFFSESDDYALCRKHMREHAEKIVDYLKSKKSLNILEVGPSSNVCNEHIQDYSTTIIAENAKKLGHSYKTLDIEGNADFVCSIDEVSKFTKDEKFDVLVLLGVIEHVGNIHLLCNEFSKITNDEALIFVNTPYMFKVHGPIPDFWRISEYGYQHLFGEKFELEFDVFPKDERGKNSFPLSFNVLMRKRK